MLQLWTVKWDNVKERICENEKKERMKLEKKGLIAEKFGEFVVALKCMELAERICLRAKGSSSPHSIRIMLEVGMS